MCGGGRRRGGAGQAVWGGGLWSGGSGQAGEDVWGGEGSGEGGRARLEMMCVWGRDLKRGGRVRLEMS